MTEYKIEDNLMSGRSLSELKQLVSNLVQEIPFLKLLILFGSRATGENHEDIVTNQSKKIQK